MAERLGVWLGATGLRARLAATVAAILMLAAATTFVAVYRGTGARIREQIDSDLASQTSAIGAQLLRGEGARPANLLRRARRSIAAEPAFAASSRLFVVRVVGAGIATNEPELLGLRQRTVSEETSADRASEKGEAAAILSAPPGLSTVQLEDAGTVELDSQPVELGGRTVANVIVGQPLGSVERAQGSVARTFLIAGSLTLAAALLAALLAAARTAAPLRRMAHTAGAVDAGELTHRMPEVGAREVRQLAESFNHMLDRLEDAFVRQHGFVSDASHELRTPLTAIRGQIEVLGRSPSPTRAEVSETVERVIREVGRMNRLVDDLLLLAQTDEGLVQWVERIDPVQFVPETVEGVTRGAERTVVVGPLPSGRLLADGDRLAQVLRNLVQNAIEHAGPDGSVRVAAEAVGSRLRVTVDDDGPGIPLEQRQAVFDRFHRTDAARARRSGGSGLGLAIAHAIVAAHGGRIWVEDAPAGGARLVFELPGFEAG